MTMERVALFAGTFDPFTKGHHALIKRALPLFDKIIIAIGNNSKKKCMFTIEERVAAIEKLYTKESRVEVKIYNCLFAHRKKLSFPESIFFKAFMLVCTDMVGKKISEHTEGKMKSVCAVEFKTER